MTIKYVWDIRIGDRGRAVMVDGVKVGHILVQKNGWGQSDLKRGSPSQVWTFRREDDSPLAVHIDHTLQRNGEYRNYAKDMKATISAAVEAFRQG